MLNKEEKLFGALSNEKLTCHAELVSASKRQIPKQVRNDVKIFNSSFFIFNSRKAAFTLAEVLITLSIIGVVAAITMPILITNTTERRNSERHANIAYKVTQAMEHMRATGTLVPYDSTESFVNELQKHLKISKICDKDHLTDCWPTDKVTDKDGNEYEVKDAKTGKHLGLNTETNNVGLVLADGAALILNYDTNTQGLDIGDRVTSEFRDLPVGNGKTKSFAYTSTVTGPIDFIMDVNGSGKPNREMDSNTNKYYDIRSLKAASFSTAGPACENGTAGCIIYIGTSFEPADCVTTSPTYAGDTLCGPTPSDSSHDYWAGAKAKCLSYSGFHLPTFNELLTIYNNKQEYDSIKDISDIYLWSADEDLDSPKTKMRIIGFDEGYIYYDPKELPGRILCLKN